MHVNIIIVNMEEKQYEKRTVNLQPASGLRGDKGRGTGPDGKLNGGVRIGG